MLKKVLVLLFVFSLTVSAQNGVFSCHVYADKYDVLTVTGATAVLVTADGARIEMKQEKPGYYKGGGFFKGWFSATWRPNGRYKGDSPCYDIKRHKHMI